MKYPDYKIIQIFKCRRFLNSNYNLNSLSNKFMDQIGPTLGKLITYKIQRYCYYIFVCLLISQINFWNLLPCT